MRSDNRDYVTEKKKSRTGIAGTGPPCDNCAGFNRSTHASFGANAAFENGDRGRILAEGVLTRDGSPSEGKATVKMCLMDAVGRTVPLMTLLTSVDRKICVDRDGRGN